MVRRLMLGFSSMVICLLAGCSVVGGESDTRDHEVIDVGASEVEIIGTSRQAVSFNFKGGLPVPCYEFEETIVDRDSQTVQVKVRAHRTATYCVQVTGTLRVSPLEVAIGEQGSYTFRFWRGEETPPLEVEVEVP